uniref:MFS transporter n=1 Tax=Marinobacterium profundum TaxID=1714300 RepID=UPI0009E973CE|nr:MFS transporter [Marinobacterium profundum]
MKRNITDAVPDLTQTPELTERGRWALASLALSMLLASLGVSIANIALPTLVEVFSASFQQVQWVIIGYLLAITVMIVSVGRLGDILGHRRVLLAGISLFTLASIMCGTASTLGLLILARALQGLGAAILMALTLALVREITPKDRTGSAMGLLGTMSAIGTALGPSLGGLLLAGPGWRAIFLILVPLGMLNILLAYRYLPASGRKGGAERKGFDTVGTLLLGLTLATYALAVTAGGGDFNSLNLALLLAATLVASLFVLAQTRVASPLIPMAALRNVVLSTSLALNVLVANVMMATLVVGPFYLSRALGLSDLIVGIVMSMGPIISALSGVPAGHLVDRLGAPFMAIAGLVAMAAGAFGLSALPAIFGVAGYLAAMAILTPGYQLFQAANNTAVMLEVSADQRGVISGLLSLSRNIGLITGAAVMGALFAFASMTTDITTASAQAIAGGMQVTFAVAGLLMVVALGIGAISRVLVKRASVRRHD